MRSIADPNDLLVLEMEEAALFRSDAAPEPDPDWVVRDPDGHEHRWTFLRPNLAATDPDGASPSLPSLRYVADSDGAHYQCKVCGWPVQPGKRSKGTGRFRPTRRVYRLNGREVSEVDARVAFSLIRALRGENLPVLDANEGEGLPEARVVGDDKR